MKQFVFFVSIIYFINSMIVFSSPTSVVGVDDRILYRELEDEKLKIVGAAVARIFYMHDDGNRNDLERKTDGTYRLKPTLHKLDSLSNSSSGEMCPEMRFADEYVSVGCSAFLVAPKILMTAAHCIPQHDSKWIVSNFLPKNPSLIINFSLGASIKPNLELNSEQTYSVRKVISAHFDSNFDFDYALIELDREVVGITPLDLDLDYSPSSNDKFLVIGHGMGLPLIFSPHGKFGSMINDATVFATSNDSFSGNSGGPVINSASGKVVGILTAGLYSDVFTQKNQCMDWNVIEEVNGKKQSYVFMLGAIKNVRELIGF